MSQYEKVVLAKIKPYDRGAKLLLETETGDKVLAISIGEFEAYSISLAWLNEKFERPLTHDLFKTVLQELESSVEQLMITDLINQTYYAMLKIRHIDKTTKNIYILNIDCRPSDGIAMALRFDAPIFVNKKLLELSDPI